MKETLAFNTTKETLFVGVGGIGSDIVTRVAKMCRGTEADNIRFVAMDTNANDLNEVKNSGARVTHVQTSSTRSVLDYLKKDEDSRKNWFPNNTTLYSKTVSEGAGQVRAISRLALNATIRNGNIQELYKAIDELFLKDGGDLKQALRVVVVSTAAGGTGSGIAMIVGMLIREYLHKHYREKAAIIRGYILLPGVLDTVISTENEREGLRRNGYATIKEINAFMIKSSGFCSVRKDLERYKDLHVDVPDGPKSYERLEGLPFDFCFLLDRVDQSQESMQTLEQYKTFAAQSLYEQNIGPMQKDAFGIEDNVIKEFANEDNLGRNRFGGIGSSILRYPYEDIVKYVAYSKAIACIGDGETVGEWLKYDKAYEKERADFKKRRAYTKDAAPTRGKVYLEKLNNGNSRFDTDIKGDLAVSIDQISAEVNSRILMYMRSFENQVYSGFTSDPSVNSMKTVAEALISEIDYEKEPEKRGKASDNLTSIRNYEAIVKNKADSAAKATAKTIFYDAGSINSEVNPYNIESLLLTNEGAMHPNAMRYMLYAIKEKFDDAYKKADANITAEYNKLAKYEPNASDPDTFDVGRGAGKKSTENTIDDVCALDKDGEGDKHVWSKLNEVLPAYAGTVKKYCDAVIKKAAYEVASKYTKQLCEEFEKFYAGFEAKVYALARKRKEIVEKLKFREGNSISYVCATEQYLNRILELCPGGEDDLMLPSALSAKIYDAVKANADNSRVAEFDHSLAKRNIDIFDTVLIDYFIESVEDDCEEVLDLNIIQAIALEKEFKEYYRCVAENNGDAKGVFTPDIDQNAKFAYIRERIKNGKKLAAAGIGSATFDEPREVMLCAYNTQLDKMIDISVPKLVQPFKINSTATNTVSKYDMHFFNAVYNITPDSLSRFRSPEICEDSEYSEGAGIYYDAYHKYIQKIGPDSTKCAAISLHTDKRWDSLSEMPEISMKAHYNEMVKIHSALVYGIIFNMIKKYQSSRYDVDKRIYVLEDTEGDYTSLVVSNNTECDEFYEVLDALYRDRASVAKIYEMINERCGYDEQSNCKYTETTFMREVENFKIGDGHKAPTSLFEIPLTYYNSLPRAKLDDNELAIMIDSIIKIIENEVTRYEKEQDRAPYLSARIESQFRLFIENFKNDEYNVNEAMRKNTTVADNRVVNMVFRKVCNKIKELNTSDFNETIKELRELVRE